MFIPGILLGVAAYLIISAFTSRQNRYVKIGGGAVLSVVACLSIYMDFKVAQIEHAKAHKAQVVSTR